MLLSSCASERQNLKLSKHAVTVFHSQLDAEEYSSIYKAADDGLKQSISESDFVRFLQGVHQTLGVMQNSVPRGTVFQLAQGTIRLDYDTTFARGAGREQFEWKIIGDRAVLNNYKINSKELATR
jgi:hypothetical protein